MVTAEQIRRSFFPGSAAPTATWRRLHRLEGARLLRRDIAWFGVCRVIRTTARGAALAEVDLGPPPLQLEVLRHHLQVVDLSVRLLALHSGSAWITERELRRDRGRAQQRDLARSRAHMPDGVLLLEDGRQVAVELDRTPKRSRRLELLFSEYAARRAFAEVWWFLPSTESVARSQTLVRRLGLDRLITVRASVEVLP